MTQRSFTGTRHPFRATVQVPGDKSLSHRALILAAMAAGTSRLAGLGPGADVAATISCLGALGVQVSAAGEVRSAGSAHWRPPRQPLDGANSGTTVRLLAGACSGRPFTTVLTGDSSLRRRPMRRLVGPLAALGARIETTAAGTAPITVSGGSLIGADVTVPEASAQVRTAVALAALQADGPTTIRSPLGYRDHTERWLGALGLGHADGPGAFTVWPGPVPPLALLVPGDPSSAAVLWAAAALGEGEVTTPGVSLNPGRTGFLEVLGAMGAEVTTEATGEVLGDPIGTVTVRGPVLRGTRVAGDLAVRTLDELPLVAIVATAAATPTVVADSTELRTKESDRVATVVGMLRSLGGEIEPASDGFTVAPRPLRAGAVRAEGDHRIAMAAAVAATTAGTVTVTGVEAAGASWPGFAEVLEAVWSSR